MEKRLFDASSRRFKFIGFYKPLMNYLALSDSGPSRSNINPKRSVLESGFLVTPLPDGMM